MNILIVGAGAVGQVYGHHFSTAGHQVSYLIKEKYQSALSNGMVLYSLNNDPDLHSPVHFTNYQLVTSWPEYKDHQLDLIVLTIPSNALRTLDFEQIKRTTESKIPILMLQPSEEDRALILNELPGQPLAEGLISLIAYQTPLLDQRHPELSQQPAKEGIACYLPPMKMPLSATDKALARNMVQLFQDSGIKARYSNSAVADSRLPSAFLMTFLCCLESADWNLKALRRNYPLLKQLAQAQQFLLPQQTAAGSD